MTASQIMSDEQLFFLVLVLLYMAESTHWIPQNSIIFKSHFGSSFRWRFPSNIFGSIKGGIAFSNPIPPFGTHFTISPLPVSFSPYAVLSSISSTFVNMNRPKREGQLHRLNDISSIDIKSNFVLLNGSIFVKCVSGSSARDLGKTLNKLTSLSPLERETYLDNYLKIEFDTQKIESKLKTFREETLFLRIICHLQFLYMFAVFPAWVFYYGFENVIWPLLLSIMILSLLLSFVFYITHLSLFHSEKEDRLKHMIMIAVYPLASIRAVDYLSYRYFKNVNIVAIASVLCKHSEFLKLASKTLRELEYPIDPASSDLQGLALETESWWRLKIGEAFLGFMEEKKLSTNILLKPHRAFGKHALSYCPRCLCEFLFLEGNCPDCRDVKLLPVAVNDCSP